jgi:hypothetical protein
MTDRRIHARSSGSQGRSASGAWRRWAVVGMLCAVVQLASPMRAYALFEWLDHLSGPGPFQGIEFQFKMLCVMDQPSREKALESVLAAH